MKRIDIGKQLKDAGKKFRDRIKRNTETASKRSREDYRAVKRQAQEVTEAQRLPEKRRTRGVNGVETAHAEAEPAGIQKLQRTAEMADPVGATLKPTAPPQQVQHFASSSGEGMEEFVTGGDRGFGVDGMVTGMGGESSEGASFGLDFGNTDPADDDIVLPGEGGSEW